MELINKINFTNLITQDNLNSLLNSIIYLLIGIIILRIIIFIFNRSLKKKLTPQSLMLLKKVITYSLLFILLLIILDEFNVHLTTILGAAGIIGLAVGLASKTSIGNIISGLFLIGERPFEIGDVIRIEDKVGIVHSIDLLSIKLRTFDNLYIRIPNEKIINTDVVNITRFPIRRLDFNISVAYKEDLEQVKEVLLDIANKNPYCLIEPEPLFLIKDFGDNGISILIGIWFEKSNYIKLKNSFSVGVKIKFDELNIEIPFPHLSIYSGTASKPIKVDIGKENS